mmetsp:Transcript_60220/g.99429  ORF Transcript_60220/g.99429 Transcript_60220/m.99429 type:complete len:224 (-) Transcript_60220:103-774(-)
MHRISHLRINHQCLHHVGKNNSSATLLGKRWMHSPYPRPEHSHMLQHKGNKLRYRVPKTWRKTFQIIWRSFKYDKVARKRSLFWGTIITVGFWGSLFGTVKFVHFFGPSGQGKKWRDGIWSEIGNEESNKAFEQMEREGNQGYIQNMFRLGTPAKMPTLEERAKSCLPADKYKTWSDMFAKGFPQSAEEYKRASKLRPETFEDFEMLEEVRKSVPVSNAQQDE